MKSLKKELWRLRFNWCFVIVVSLVYSISTVGISSSFHQFVTNPRVDELESYGNETDDTKLEPGLGESELFYSLLISGFNFGYMIGGISTGILLKCIPPWYLWLTMILSHTSGYIIYSLANQGWLIMVSKLLSGYFLGADLTLGFSYLSVSSVKYTDIQRERGEKVDEKVAIHLRNILFAINGISFSIGYFLGPAATVIFAQFQSVDQFRAIGWYNVAWGVALLILLVTMFRGESSCDKITNCREVCQLKGQRTPGAKLEPLQIFIVITMLILALVEIFRFGILETLFNPILSDSFGLNERDSSYVFFAFGIAHVTGSILLYILEKLKLSSQIITFFALLLTVAGYLLLGDWQAIPYDPCTEYSPFHHPEMIQNGSIVKLHTNSNQQPTASNLNSTPIPNMVLHLSSVARTQVTFGDRDIDVNSILSTKYSSIACEKTQTCQVDEERHLPIRLYLTVDNLGNLLYDSPNDLTLEPTETFECVQPFLQQTVLCVNIFSSNHSNEDHQNSTSAHIESLQVLPDDLYWTARNICMSANVTGRQCHWIPNSLLTKRDCEDCQPICRSLHQILTFPQFILGLGLLLLSNSLLWVTLIALLFNQLPGENQGIVMGIRTTLNGFTRTVIPLILDAVYEGTQKRTFVIMAVMVIVHLPFFVEIIVLYRQLGPRSQTEGYSEIKERADSDTEQFVHADQY